MIMCLSGVWTGVGVEKIGRGYDYMFIWCLDRSGVEKVGRGYS